MRLANKTRIVSSVAALILFAALAAYGSPKPKQGMCHTCHCDSKANKCVNYCGSKKMCVIACAHDCQMKAHGIKQCSKPIEKDLKSYQ